MQMRKRVEMKKKMQLKRPRLKTDEFDVFDDGRYREMHHQKRSRVCAAFVR
jgi:hypothetical protein